MEKTILVYDNHTNIVESMAPLLKGEGIGMIAASDLAELGFLLENENVHLLLIDVELGPEGWGGGIELIAGLRKKSSIPIMVVSGQTAETAKIMALNSGADDYVTVDCNPLELLARVKSQLRRYTQLAGIPGNLNSIYTVDGLEVNDLTRTVCVEGRDVKLTPIEYKILRLLIREKGKVFSISQIYEAIWNMQAIGADNTIAVHIRHIREKIERNPKDPRYLKVVWGTGYKVG